MNLDDIKKLDKQYFMNVYSMRFPVCFSCGRGVKLYDIDGREYTDFLAGIATNILGYAHPSYSKAVKGAVDSIIHCSNLFYSEAQALLEKKLCESSFADKVFLSNSGSEANEGAVKLARKFFYKKGENRYKVISLNNSFHGRTLAMVAATGQAKYQKPYHPLPEGFVNVPYGDIDAIKHAIDENTCAVMMELVQGEGGIILMDKEYVQAVHKLCDERGILLIFDEVQTGIGRTGKLFAYEHFGVEPDIMTLAKALGGGVPIGAILCSDYAHSFEPGDHGTTFGGNPLACTAALSVLEAIENENLLENCVNMGKMLKNGLVKIRNKYGFIKDVRGIGLIVGMELDKSIPVTDIIIKMLEKGYVIGPSGNNTLRFVPPLIIDEVSIEGMLKTLDTVFAGIQEEIKCLI